MLGNWPNYTSQPVVTKEYRNSTERSNEFHKKSSLNSLTTARIHCSRRNMGKSFVLVSFSCVLLANHISSKLCHPSFSLFHPQIDIKRRKATMNELASSEWVIATLGVVEFFLRKSKSLHSQYVHYAIGNKNPRNKNSTMIEFDASAVCVSVFGQFWLAYHGLGPLKTQILRFKKFKNFR